LIQAVRVRSVEQGGTTPAVALTAYSRAHDRMRALHAGFNAHVPKPVDAMELITVVASLANRLGHRR
jgi:CheY-like chemotaxis protein